MADDDKIRKELEDEILKKMADEEKVHSKNMGELKKKIDKLQKELDKKKKEDGAKIAEVKEEADELEKNADKFREKVKEMKSVLNAGPEVDGEDKGKKLEQCEKIVAYLRGDNKKLRDETSGLKVEVDEITEENARLLEAASNGWQSLENAKQEEVHLLDVNKKLSSNLKKWQNQNEQLGNDLASRTAYHKAEMNILSEYKSAMEKMIELLTEKCSDPQLVEDITKEQLACESAAKAKAAGGGTSVSSGTSDI